MLGKWLKRAATAAASWFKRPLLVLWNRLRRIATAAVSWFKRFFPALWSWIKRPVTPLVSWFRLRFPMPWSLAVIVTGFLLFGFVQFELPPEKHDLVVRLILGGFGLALSATGLAWAAQAAANSKRVIDTFVNIIDDFEMLARHVNDKFLCRPGDRCRASAVKLALLSPAFGALDDDSAFFDKFVSELGGMPEDVSIEVIVLAAGDLVEWYKDMVRLLAKGWARELQGNDGQQVANEKVHEKIRERVNRVVDRLNTARKCFRKTLGDEAPAGAVRSFQTVQYVPIQIFLREDDECRSAMYGIMGSEFPAKAIRSFENPNYDVVMAFSRGFYSQLPHVVRHCQTMFSQLKGKAIDANVETYFDQIRPRLAEIVTNPALLYP